MHHTFSDLANRILAHPAPILLLDTCSILDITRVPVRENLSDVIVSAAKELTLRTSKNPPEIWLVVSEFVKREWCDHADNLRTDLGNQIKNLDNKITPVRSAFIALGIGPPLVDPELQSLKIDHHLYNLSKNILDNSYIVIEDSVCTNKAIQRYNRREAPAVIGSSPNDCTIIEHYLELCVLLREKSFSEKIVFISSNTNDYREQNNLKEPLVSQFSKVSLEYMTDIGQLLRRIT